MTDDDTKGVESQVASGTDVNDTPQVVHEEQQLSSQEINWKRANETMAQQAAALKQKEAELAEMREQIARAQRAIDPDDDEIPTYKDIKAVREEIAALKQQAEVLKYERSEGIEVDTLLKKYGSEVPIRLQNAILKSGDIGAAIEACKQTPSYIRDHFQAQTSPEAQRIISNADKPKSPGAVGSSGSLSKTDKLKSMTAEERIQLMHRYSRSQG